MVTEKKTKTKKTAKKKTEPVKKMSEKKKLEKSIIKDIKKEGVPEEIAEKEEKIAEETEKKPVEEVKETKEESKIKSVKDKGKELLERAKELREKIAAESLSSEELKEKVKAKKKADMLLPLEEYVKSGIYLGTRVVTPNMKPFVYRRRADGLAIFNTNLIDEKLKQGIEFLSQFKPDEIILVCKRQAGWRAAEMFSKLTGIRTFTKKYPAGILTNSNLPDFFENELTIITDSWLDRNALNDTLRVNKKILMICDTNNFSKGADEIIIGNNKSERSIGLIFYLFAKKYCKAQKLENLKNIPDLDWWLGEKSDIEQEAKRKVRAGARFGV